MRESQDSPCKCGSKKPFKNCCSKEREVTDSMKRTSSEPGSLQSMARRGYRRWADLMDMDRQRHGVMNRLGARFLQPIDDFCKFWTRQYVSLLETLKGKRSKLR